MLIGRAMMDKTRADFAVVNSGGVRESLPAGKLTYKDVLKVQPFGNTQQLHGVRGRWIPGHNKPRQLRGHGLCGRRCFARLHLRTQPFAGLALRTLRQLDRNADSVAPNAMKHSRPCNDAA
jgi:hypothetical protein